MSEFLPGVPGVYQMTVAQYLADPVATGSLSSTGARRLLPPSCPAKFRYEADHPAEPAKHLDHGHAAHRLVLGAGMDIVIVQADDWRPKFAQQARKAAHAEGRIPLLPKEMEVVEAMAQAIRQHPVASVLFQPGSGLPEQTLIWQDKPTGVWRRALLDWLPYGGPFGEGRMLLADYKTAASVNPTFLQKAIYDHGYHIQAAWYLAGAQALKLAEKAAFLFVFQEKEPPYLVTVVEPDATALRVGHIRAREAIQVYAECVAAGRWPGYSDEVEMLGLPPWAEARELEQLT